MLQETKTQLDNIYYISMPPEHETIIGDFIIDTSIKLPVETNNIENWNIKDLSWEMIISAMLKILAYQPDHKDIDYFREFIFAVRPNIIGELSDSGIIKSKNRDFELANEIFLAIEGLSPNNDRNALNIALLQEEKLNFMEASGDNCDEQLKLVEKLYLNLLNRDAVLSDTYFNAGYFFIKVRNFDRAENCFKSFILSSDNEEKIEKAKKVLKEYRVLIDNEDFFNKAYSAILDENEHQAITLLETFLNKNPKIWNAWFLLGWAYRRLSSFSEAQNALLKALNINSKEPEIYNELAICTMESGNYSDSRSYLETALNLNPEDLKVVSNMGILELKLGNTDSAKKFFETVLALDPNDPIAKNYIDKL